MPMWVYYMTFAFCTAHGYYTTVVYMELDAIFAGVTKELKMTIQVL